MYMNTKTKHYPSFMAELIERTVKDYNNARRQAEKLLDPHRSNIEAVAKNIERVAKLYESVYGITPEKSLDKIEEDVRGIIESREFVTVPAPSSSPQEKTQVVSLTQEDKEELAKLVAKMILEASSSSIKTKRDALFAKPIVDLPESAYWESLTIQFTDKEKIEVLYKDTKLGIYDYDTLGFAKNGKGERVPTEAWKFLLMLSLMQNPDDKKERTGEYQSFEQSVKKIYPTRDVILHDANMGFSKGNTIEKRKSELSKRLRAAFGIDEEPFHSYDKKYGYAPKFKLCPPLGLRGDGEVDPSGGKFYDETYNDDDEEEGGSDSGY